MTMVILGDVYFYVYLPIIQTNDNSKPEMMFMKHYAPNPLPVKKGS